MNQDEKGLMYMFTILFLNQKGGVGKTTYPPTRRAAPSTRSAMTRTTPSPAITRLSIRLAF